MVEFLADLGDRGMATVVHWSGLEGNHCVGKPLPAPVNVDVLEMPGPVSEISLSSQMASGDEQTVISRLGVTLYNTREPVVVDIYLPPRPVDLPVPFLSQFAGGAADDDSRCCPTSAVMILRYFGVDVELDDFARRSYDPRHSLYGNWSLTVATMSSFGLRAWVQKHSSSEELYTILDEGRPVILSVRFAEGQLPGAPIAKTTGHLLVARGCTAQGDILVNDPAGRSAESGCVTYEKSAFFQAWLKHGGIAIHAVPEETGQ